MYKTRIHQWGLDKKLKEHEARAIIHMYARRRGKATRMRLRDLIVDIEKAYSHFQRKKITIDSVLASDAVSLSDLVCETPAASPTPMPQDLIPIELADSIIPELQSLMTMAGPQDIGSPKAFRVGEMLVIDAREYLLCSIHFKHGHDRVRNKSAGVSYCIDVYCTIQRARRLFNRDQEIQALDLVAKGCSMLEDIVEYMPCDAVLTIIQLIAILVKRQRKQQSLALMLWKQLYPAAINSKFREHPIISVFGRLFSNLGLLLHNDDAPDYLLATIHVFIDSLKTILGPVHLRTIHATVVLSRVTALLYGPEGLLKPLETLRSSLVEQHGWGITQSILIMLEIIELSIDCGHYQTARNLIRELKKLVLLAEMQNVSSIGWTGHMMAYSKTFMRHTVMADQA